jgi:hypothetical protein
LRGEESGRKISGAYSETGYNVSTERRDSGSVVTDLMKSITFNTS